MLIDSHCHLDFPELNSNLLKILDNAFENDVQILQTISTKISQFYKIVKIASQHSKIYCSLGVHPLNVSVEGVISHQQLIALTSHPKVIGIGETGLDYYYDASSRYVQILSLNEHIKTSQDTELPIVIHSRDAEEDTLQILKENMLNKPFKGIMHCFTGTLNFAKACLDLGLYISFSGIVTFKNATQIQEVANYIPLGSMLIETDAPFLAPQAYRGKSNQPAYIKETAKFLADLRGISYESLANTTSQNFLNLFNKVKCTV